MILTVPNEDVLLQEKLKLESLGIRFAEFIEPDLCNSLTAVASEPICGNQRKLFSNYPLLRKEVIGK